MRVATHLRLHRNVLTPGIGDLGSSPFSSSKVICSSPVGKVSPIVPVKPKIAQKESQDEAVPSASQQRKADWAIMKEMARYLWPKASMTLSIIWLRLTISLE
jgi:hypothetical protein